MLNMGATLFGLTVVEALRGVTMNAAAALGLSAEVGTLEAGKTCDLAIWDVTDPADLVYRIGFTPLHKRIKAGQCSSPPVPSRLPTGTKPTKAGALNQIGRWSGRA